MHENNDHDNESKEKSSKVYTYEEIEDFGVEHVYFSKKGSDSFKAYRRIMELFASPDHTIKKGIGRNQKQIDIKVAYDENKVIDFINNHGKNIDEQQKMYNTFIFMIKMDHNLSKDQIMEAQKIPIIQNYETKKKMIIDMDRMKKKAIIDKKKKLII